MLAVWQSFPSTICSCEWEGLCVLHTQYPCLFLALNLSFHLGFVNANSMRSSGMCWLYLSSKGLQFESPLLHLGAAVYGKVCVCCTHSCLASSWLCFCSIHLVIMNVHSIRSSVMCGLHLSSKGLQLDRPFLHLGAAVYGKVCVCCTHSILASS